MFAMFSFSGPSYCTKYYMLTSFRLDLLGFFSELIAEDLEADRLHDESIDEWDVLLLVRP